MFKILGSIKSYGVAILSVISAVLLALLYRSKAKYESARSKAVEEVLKTERKSTEAMTKGLDREAKARAEVEKRIAEFARGKRP